MGDQPSRRTLLRPVASRPRVPVALAASVAVVSSAVWTFASLLQFGGRLRGPWGSEER